MLGFKVTPSYYLAYGDINKEDYFYAKRFKTRDN